LEQSKAAPKWFAREATGLVRELGSVSVAFFILANFGVFFTLYFVATLAPLIGGNLGVALILIAIPMVAMNLIYWSFMTIIPRTGGDYVFNSRFLHPSVGLVGNLVYGLTLVLYIPISAVTFNTTGLGALFSYLGVEYSSGFWSNLGAIAGSPSGIAGIGVVYILLAAVVAIPSIRTYLRIQNVTLWAVTITVILFFGSLALTSHSAFVSGFNSFASKYTGTTQDYYTNVTSSASAAGFTPPNSSPFGFATIELTALFAFLIITQTVGSQLGGETRSPKRTGLYGIMGAMFYLLALFGIGIGLAYFVFGSNFFASINYLLYFAPTKVPLPGLPYLDVIWATAAPPALAILVLAMSGFQQFIYTPAAITYFSRGLFAYSFDRIFPAWFSRVNDRTHSPLNGIIAATAISLGLFGVIELPLTASYVYLLTSAITWVTAIFPALLVAISAIVLWKLRPQYAKMSPIRGPILTLLGIIVAAFEVLVVYLYLSQSVYGANAPIPIELMASLVIVTIIIFVAARLYRGSNLSLAFKEIPPE
jgi:amino acid transporter